VGGTGDELRAAVIGLGVGTQAANTKSIRFYEDAGFRYRNGSYVFNRHLENQELL